MKKSNFTIIENKLISDTVYVMALSGDTDTVTVPGQFVEIELNCGFLRRPFSIFDKHESGFSIAYKVIGKGTERMTELDSGTEVNVLTGLGNGFDLSRAGCRPLLLGGGIGIAGIHWLCKSLITAGAKPAVVLGLNTAAEDCYSNLFKSFAADVAVTTVDGSAGVKGFVTNGVEQFPDATFLYACGPLPMLKAVVALDIPGQVSMEARMGCGFGACMGCSIETKYGSKRVCKEGPVFDKEDIVW